MRTTITCAADPLLRVHVDRNNPASPVTYNYDDGDEQTTPYQAADLPMDDQQAAALVNDWLDPRSVVQLVDDDGHRHLIDLADLRVRLAPRYDGDGDELTVECGDLRLITAMGLPANSHGAYLEFMAWEGLRCTSDTAAHALERAIERRVEAA